MDPHKKREWLRKMEAMPPDQRRLWQREIDVRELEDRIGIVASKLRKMPPEMADKVIAQIKQEEQHLEKMAIEKDNLDTIHRPDPDRETEWEKHRDFIERSMRRYIERAHDAVERSQRGHELDDALKARAKQNAKQRDRGPDKGRERERD